MFDRLETVAAEAGGIMVRISTASGGIRLAAASMFWSLAVIAVWVGGRAACPGNQCHVPDLDGRILGILHAWQRPWLDALFVSATWLGSIMVLLPLALALAWHYRRGRSGMESLLLPVGVAGAWLLAAATKLLVTRPRPALYPSLVSMPADWSFPSAHAMQVTAFAIGWWLISSKRPGWVVIGVGTLLVMTVAVSRLYLQVHFPSDVLTGVIAAAAWMVGLRMMLGMRA